MLLLCHELSVCASREVIELFLLTLCGLGHMHLTVLNITIRRFAITPLKSLILSGVTHTRNLCSPVKTDKIICQMAYIFDVESLFDLSHARNSPQLTRFNLVTTLEKCLLSDILA